MKLDHAFKASFVDTNICQRCKHPKEKHGPTAICDSCTNTGILQEIDGILMCRDCVAANIATSLPSVPVAELTSSTVRTSALSISREIDNSIRFSGDVFNSKTVAILEIETAIKNDDSIPSNQKQAAVLAMLVERANTYKKAIFEKRESLMKVQQELESEQSGLLAVHQHFNELAKGLQESERAKYKLESINYKPSAPKSTTPKVKKPAAPKFSLADTAKLCQSVGVSVSLVQSLIVSKGITPLEAIGEALTMLQNSAKK